MKDLIRKILKEEEDGSFNWTDSVINSPNELIRDAGRRFNWETYIPIIGKKIKFYFNPEFWNLTAKVRIEDIQSLGHGSFGDEPHKDYQPSILTNLINRKNEQTYYSTKDSLGDNKYVDVERVIDDLKGYSSEVKQYTDEYQRQIESLTRTYIEKISGLGEKYNFNGGYGAEAVVVTPNGEIKKNDDFPDRR